MTDAAKERAERIDAAMSGFMPSPARELFMLAVRTAGEHVQEAMVLNEALWRAASPSERMGLVVSSSLKAAGRNVGCMRDGIQIVRNASDEARATVASAKVSA